ncbi:MAG: hypothetical protein SH868_18100 [Bythopirellula sp.]|nr:hypothetical protein [Bythopirellula sp.]
MHERTQRRVCRMAFVFACAVPTVLTIGWVLYFHRPWQERDWQRSVESALHVRAELVQVSAPRPLERELFNLRLVDLNSSLPLLSVDRLHIHSQQTLAAEQIDVNRRQLPALATTISIWLAGSEFQPLSISARQLVFTDETHHSWTFNNVRAKCEVTATNVKQIAIQAELGETTKPLQILIERHPDGMVRTTLDTQQAKLPTWLLADLVPGAGRWDGATFGGTAQGESNTKEIVGTLRGSIAPIDAQAWIGKDSPQRVQAQAKLHLEHLNWRDGRIESVQGLLETSAGTASPPLLKAFQESLLCVLPDETILSAQEPIKFDQFACRFRLNSGGLTVSGTFPVAGSAGCLIAAAGKPLVMQPSRSELPLGNFVRVFCPLEQNWLWLPATVEAIEFAEKLPLSEANKSRK